MPPRRQTTRKAEDISPEEITGRDAELVEVRASVLEQAETIIHGDRRQDYGDAEESFNNIAAGWSVIAGVEISSLQVCLMMDWLKTCRAMNTYEHGSVDAFRDSLVDKAGYTGLGAIVTGLDVA